MLLRDIGIFLMDHNFLEESKTYFDKLMVKMDEDKEDIAAFQIDLASAFLKKKSPDSCLEYLEKAVERIRTEIRKSPNEDASQIVAKMYFDIGKKLFQSKDKNKAKYCFSKAMENLKEVEESQPALDNCKKYLASCEQLVV